MICFVGGILMRKVKHNKHIRTASQSVRRRQAVWKRKSLFHSDTLVMVDANFFTPSCMLDSRQVTGSCYIRYEYL